MRAVALLLVAGCNQVFGLDPTLVQRVDSAVDGPGCSSAPFVNPTQVPGLVIGLDPAISATPFELWYTRIGQPFDLYVATRTDASGDFGAGVPFAFNSTANDVDPALSADGLSLVFISERIGGRRVFESSRPSIGAPFSPPAEISTLSGTSAAGIDLSFDGLVLYVVDGQNDLYAVTRGTRVVPFGAPSAILASGIDFPSVSPDGLELFFSRPGEIGVYRRTRADPAAQFDPQDELINLDFGDPDLAPSAEVLYVDNANGEILTIQRTCR